MNEKELLQEARHLHVEKTDASKAMTAMATECAERNDIQKQQVIRLKDYSYYRGSGWDGSPIVLAKGTKFPDRVSPCFRRLAQIVSDCQDAGCLDWLDEYFNAMAAIGINITVDYKDVVAKDPADVKATIASLSGYQKVICDSSDEIIEFGKQAEELDVVPSNKFKELVAFIVKKEEGKDIEDPVQNRITFCELYESALNKVQDDAF